MTTLHTERLRLEPFDVRHLEGLHAMNSRSEVMRFLGGDAQTKEQTAAGISRVKQCWAAWGTSWWAFIELKSERIAGAGCIQYLRREASPPEDVSVLRGNPLEIGWRLHPDFWHLGYASEAARRMAAFAFETFAIEGLAGSPASGELGLGPGDGSTRHALQRSRALVWDHGGYVCPLASGVGPQGSKHGESLTTRPAV